MYDKRKYEAPEIEIMEFECEDVITTSGKITDENELPDTNSLSGFGFSGFNLY